VDACGYVDKYVRGYFGLGHLVIEVDLGSATSRGRRPENSWFVRVRNGEASVIMSWGLSRMNAEHLACRLAEVIAGAVADRGDGSWPGPDGAPAS